jgi:hypothetical protein
VLADPATPAYDSCMRSGCDYDRGSFATTQLIHEYNVKAILGPSCASLAHTVVEIADYYSIPVIGYSIPR